MNKMCTTMEQSKKLMELGIDVNTADMWWQTSNEEGVYEQENPRLFVGSIPKYMMEYLIPIPAWSLAALLELMPKDESKTIDLCLGGSNGIDHTFDWFCTCDENEDPYTYKTFHTSSPIDCTFEMVVWLKENDKL